MLRSSSVPSWSALVGALLALALACGTTAGCAGKQGFDGRVYHAGRASFRVGPVPSGWRKTDAVDGAMLAFTDDPHGGMVSVYGRCGKDGDDVPLSALTQHLLIGFTEREVTEQKLVSLDGREALHTVLTAKLDGVRTGLSLYVLKKDGCVYDLSYAAPPSTFGQGLPAFDAFATGFATISAPANGQGT